MESTFQIIDLESDLKSSTWNHRTDENQIKLVAELLLEKETINHDDLVSLIGARPFKAHKSYLEFISANEDAKQKMADAGADTADGKGGEESSATAEAAAAAGGGGDAATKTEGGSAAGMAGDGSDSAATQGKKGAGGSSSKGASGSKEP